MVETDAVETGVHSTWRWNTVDFVESRQSQPCRFGPIHHVPYRQQYRPRQDVEFMLLLICCQNQQQSWPYQEQLPICCRFRQQLTF